MKRKTTRKIISGFIALMMFASTFTGVLTLNTAAVFAAETVLAAETDSFAMNFSDNAIGEMFGDNVTTDTLNTEGKGQIVIAMDAKPFASVHSGNNLIPANNSAQNANTLLIDNQTTKWCSNNNPSPVWFILDAGESHYAKAYAIRSAEDCASYPIRFLHTWTIEASDSPEGPWVTISAPGAQGTGWNANHQLRVFDFDNPTSTPYRYYRLEITRQGNTAAGTAVGSNFMQFSYFGLVDDYGPIGSDAPTEYLTTQVLSGLSNHWAGSRLTMNGPNALRVGGNIKSAAGQETIAAKSYTAIQRDLQIKVEADTKLGYMFAPEGRIGSKDNNNYDYKYHGAHMSIDLKFSDGSYLRNLSAATDQYGIKMNPDAQGKGKVHKTYQWNYVECELGKYAAGKTITDILVGFEMSDATPGHKAVGWFDDIKIWRDTRDFNAISPADLVDIRQGANVQGNATGAIFPSVNTPDALQYLVPTTQRTSANKYEWQDTTMYGFTTSHVASRHMGERLTFLFMADAVTTSITNSDIQSAVDNAQAKFSHANESSYQNYHYTVTFDPANELATNYAPGVTMEVTPTDNGAVLRFTFPEGAASRNIVFEAPHSTTNNRSNMVSSENNQTFTAWAQNGADTNSSTGGNAALRRKHMYGEFSAAPQSFFIPSTGRLRSMARFPELKNGPDGSTVIEMRIATSWINAEQAKKNFAMDLINRGKDEAVGTWEISDGKWFESVKAEARAKWNSLLGQVEIDDPTANYWQLSNFYSKLARAYMYPTRLSEYTGAGSQGGWQYASPYRGTNVNPTIMDGYMIYNEGWWDTFKSKWPLQRFLTPQAAGTLTDGIIQHYIDQDGRGVRNGSSEGVSNMVGHSVPRWINPGGNNMMSGTSSDAIIADMFINGVDFDMMNGYNAFIKNSAVYSSSTSTGGRAGLELSNFIGYRANVASSNNSNETTWSLEGYENDAAQAHMLKKMAAEVDSEATIEGYRGDYWQQRWTEEAAYYENRAKQYVTIFNPAKGGWFRVRNANGTWRETDEAFDPLMWGGGYSEDDAWPYRVLVPQDGRGLGNLFGEVQGVSGPKALGNILDDAFAAEGSTLDMTATDYGSYGAWIHEIGEKREVKLGQFGLSNQPAYHMPWMYAHTDQPWKTQYWTRTALARAYSGEAIGYGYMGEEDNGAMSSFYVWSALGLYPLEAASGNLIIGSPAFQKIAITKDNGQKITINAENNSFDNVYIQSMKVNGQDYHKTYLTLDLLSQPNLALDYIMGPTPNTTWFTEAPPSLTEGDELPDILIDLTDSDTPIVAETITATDAVQIAVTNIDLAGSTGASSLFDNSSSTSANFTGTAASITYFDPAAPKAEMYTLTSSSTNGTSPKAWKLYGSGDGTNWSVLDERSNETFNWVRYTRPFAIDTAKQGRYAYYKLEIAEAAGTEPLRLAEFELLADQFARDAITDFADINFSVSTEGTVTANVSIGNTGNYYSVLAIVAVYDEKGALCDATSNPIVAKSGALTEAQFIVKVMPGGYTAKAFLWNEKNLIPICQSASYSFTE